jgi:hypothetical protein
MLPVNSPETKGLKKAKPTIFEIFASIQKLIDFLKTG